jgi:hypothetical protein
MQQNLIPGINNGSNDSNDGQDATQQMMNMRKNQVKSLER